MEVLLAGELVGVRDSKYLRAGRPTEEQPVIVCSRGEWEDLCGAAADGRSSPSDAEIGLTLTDDGGGSIISARDEVSLVFTADEITAFLGGVRNGEFGLRQTSA